MFFLYGKKESAVFSPLDLSPLLWLDASDESTITESGGAVSQWDDKSGNGNHVVQAAGGLQPTTGVNTFNGLNVLYFAYDLLALPSGLLPTFNGDVTFFVVCNTTANGFMYPVGGRNLSGSPRLAYFIQDQFGTGNPWATQFQMGTRGIYSTNCPNDRDLHNYHMLRDDVAGEVSSYYDGNLMGSRTGNLDDTLAGAGFGGFPTTGGAFVGNIAEAILYDNVLSVDEHNQVGQYLADKWGIPWSNMT